MRSVIRLGVLEIHPFVAKRDDLLRVMINYKGSATMCLKAHGSAQGEYFDTLIMFRDDAPKVTWHWLWETQLKEVEVTNYAPLYTKTQVLYGEFFSTSLWKCSSKVCVTGSKVVYSLDHSRCKRDTMNEILGIRTNSAPQKLSSDKQSMKRLLSFVESNGVAVCVSRPITLPGVYDDQYYFVDRPPRFIEELFRPINVILEICRSESQSDCSLASGQRGLRLIDFLRESDESSEQDAVHADKPIIHSPIRER